MSKYAEEFVRQHKTVGRIKGLTLQMKRTHPKEYLKIQSNLKRFKLKPLK